MASWFPKRKRKLEKILTNPVHCNQKMEIKLNARLVDLTENIDYILAEIKNMQKFSGRCRDQFLQKEVTIT